MIFNKQKRKTQNVKRKMESDSSFCSAGGGLHFALCTDSGFTLVELMVTIGIFIFLTALVVAKYGSFNDGTLLTSMSYDIALALRDAQSYGLNVQGTQTGTTQSFSYPYGMDFSLNQTVQNQMILFADSSPLNGTIFGDGICSGVTGPTSLCVLGQSGGDNVITSYTLARGGSIRCLSASTTPPTKNSPCTPSNVNTIDITFKRPDPNAIIVARDSGGNVILNNSSRTWPYAVIQVEDASKTSTRSIVVNETGEIAVQNQ